MSDKGIEIVAAIDAGSNAFRMLIAEIMPDGRINPLDELRKLTHIGRDTYAYGSIQISSIHEACEILKGFSRLMDDYGVTRYRAVCTSGIREAQNREYMLEQIRLRTGLTVEVINNSEERFLTYKAIGDHLPDYGQIRDEGTLIVDIGSGGVEVALYNKGYFQFAEYIKVGSLRLREILADLERETLDFPAIMEEFIDSKIYMLEPIIRDMNPKNFVGLGGELKAILQLGLGKKKAKKEKYIARDQLDSLYTQIRPMTKGQIIKAYNIAEGRAEVLLPALIIFTRFIKMTSAKGIHTPMVSLRHGLLADMVDERDNTLRKREFQQDILSSVRYIGKKYRHDEVHACHVEALALSIFDQTDELHGLSKTDRFYLQIAAVLHDIGKYINLDDHDLHSYNILNSLDIMGMSDRAIKILSNTARFHSEESPLYLFSSYRELLQGDRVVVSKLTAILQLADSLDISHKQKIEALTVMNQGEKLEFVVQSVDDILLERWTFEQKVKLFEETMGKRPVIRKKGRLV